MTPEVQLIDVIFPDGTRRTVELHVFFPDEGEEDYYEVGIELDGKTLSGVSDRGVFFALQELRRKLDQTGMLLDCEGASEDVYPSGMIESMGPAVKAYRLKLGSQARMSDLVGIFDRGPLTKPASVEAQEKFFRAWGDWFVARRPST